MKELARALEVERPDDVMKLLLDAWQKHRGPELRQEVLDCDASLALPAFEGSAAAWNAAAASATAGERGPLFRALKGPQVADTLHRLRMVAKFPADPRLNAAVEALLAEVPYSADSSKPVWTAAFGLIADSGDPHFAALAQSLPAKWKVRASMKQWLGSAFARAIAELPREAPALDAESLGQLEQLRARFTPSKPKPSAGRDEAAVLASIYASPFEDGPRRVYADLLAERGDPRAELITLQLAQKGEAQAAKLLKANVKKWLGPLAPVLGKFPTFRRGFLAQTSVKFRHQADAEKYGSLPEWATVEELTWSQPNPVPRGQEPWCGFVGPTMRGLKRAQGPWVPHLLAAKEPWAIEWLGIVGGRVEHLRQALESPRLPKLASVALFTGDVNWLQGFEWPARVERLQVALYSLGVPLLQRASALPLKRLDFGEQVTFTRGADGALSKVQLRLAGMHVHLLGAFAQQLPDGALESLEVDTTRAIKGVEAAVAVLEAKVRKAGAKAALPKAGEGPKGPQPFRGVPYATSMDALADGTAVIFTRNAMLHVDAAKGVELREMPLGLCTAARVLPGEQHVFVVSHKRFTVKGLRDGNSIAEGELGMVHQGSISLTDDGRYISVASRVVDLQKHEQVEAPRGASLAVLMSPDRTCWLRSPGGAVEHQLVRLGSKKGVPLEHGKALFDPQFFHGELFARTRAGVCVYSCETGALLRFAALADDGRTAMKLFVGPGAKLLATATGPAEVTVFDGATLKPGPRFTLPGYPVCGAFSLDEKQLFVATTEWLGAFDVAGGERPRDAVAT